MITNSKVHIGLPANVTTIGSEIQLFCGNQTSQKSVSPVLTAFCGENGTWSPDIRSGHIECAVDQKSTDGKIILLLHHGLHKQCIMLCASVCSA